MTVSIIILSNQKPWYASGDYSNPVIKPKAKRTVKPTPPLLYSQFEQCAKQETDPFWASVFEKAAHDQFPNSFQFRETNLTFKSRGKIHSAVIDMSDVQKTISGVKLFMQQVAGIYSQIDMAEKASIERERALQRQMTVINVTWSSLRSAKQRQSYLFDFCRRLVNKNNLSPVMQEDSLDVFASAANEFWNQEYIPEAALVIPESKKSAISCQLRFPKSTGIYRNGRE